MMVRTTLTVAVICTALAGCASFYTYDGKQYNSRAEFLGAVDAGNQAGVNAIVPLPAPVAKKTLIFALPTQATVTQQSIRNYTSMKGSAPMANQVELFNDLAEAATRGMRYLHDGVVRKNIYSQVRLLPVDSLMAQPTPSEREDVLFYNESAPGAGQWYFANAKYGRQVLPWDRAQPTIPLRLKAFVDSVQLQAIRE